MDYRNTAAQSLASSSAEAREETVSFDEPVEEFQAESDIIPSPSLSRIAEEQAENPPENSDDAPQNPAAEETKQEDETKAAETPAPSPENQTGEKQNQNAEDGTPINFLLAKDDRTNLKRKEQEDTDPATGSNTIAEDVDHTGMPIENDPESALEGKTGPLGTPDEFGITQFIQTWDAMCGRYTENDQCIPSCPFYNETIEGNCVITQFPRTDALLSWCGAVLQKYMQTEASDKSRRIDVMMQLVPGFSEEYLSEAGKCTALDHVERPAEETEKTWLDLLREALPGFDEREFSEAGLKALKQKIHR